MLTDTAVMTAQAPAHTRRRRPEPLLRAALGEALRGFRRDRNVTLRELAETARVSPGYLSEIERGRKEASSELLAAVCHGLGVSLADVLIEAAGSMAIGEAIDEAVEELTELPAE
ncbi:hypothetical protein CFRA_07175 [Corynebacterium frankenforstense DSM 45800]|uniref:HTH cro/C1-type domain-containing protein n=1 Tax=Corynebacterium frankenforstense DSM 45800 TaxID=1437875 RepID=A0A1L7CTC8_9CORY|nr:helix-turn-helix transcriptional regulator [Corynebacterium frankenforstense]APT89071.1 hypothetical protein CFRA_07175 [Corynebacterium frankenforstense DSM 45800]